MKNETDRCIALAGVFQAAGLASRIAHRGVADSDAMEASLYSLLQVDPESVTAVYGGLQGVVSGLRTLAAQLSGSDSREVEITRYVIALLHLERKLSAEEAMLERLADGIRVTQARLEHYPLIHPNILAGLAGLYSDTISTLQPRIMVQGDPLHLQNPENVNRVRALLLAGIRSAMLWRQCGGRRFQVIFGRSRQLRLARELLHQAQHPPET
ncbi:MAG TPA: lysogenization regulator HflD [Sedimenticola sp.]|nr:lysogenization regulator HflD [Sedimenticola sp.]